LSSAGGGLVNLCQRGPAAVPAHSRPGPDFRANDGSNCDHNIDTSTLEGRRAAYSLLLSRGLIRIFLSVPASAQFSVVSVENPYGCNDTSTLSMYRRPLPATNLRFLSTVMFDGRESSPQTGTQKITYATNPGDLLADLAHQAIDATTGHAQAAAPPTPQQVQDIVNFEMQLRTAQAIDFHAGSLNAGGASGGPVALASLPFFIGINDSFPVRCQNSDILSIQGLTVRTCIRARLHPHSTRYHPGVPPLSRRYRSGRARPPTTGRRPQAETAATKLELL
jgi:hypothetical protein